MTILDHFFKEHIEYDFFRTFCGERLGGGAGRDVYAFGLDEEYVIKFEGRDQSFQNIAEWQLWNKAVNTDNHDIIKWLAPCDRISPSGRVLIQKRTKPLKPEKFPKRIPSFLGDTKYNNYGMLGKQFVCHDYGTHDLQVCGFSKRMYSPKWSSDE